jgi:hypothetical protein
LEPVAMSAGVLSEDSLPERGHVLVWGEAQGVNGYGGGRGGAGGKGDVKIPVGVREEGGEEEGFFKAKNEEDAGRDRVTPPSVTVRHDEDKHLTNLSRELATHSSNTFATR